MYCTPREKRRARKPHSCTYCGEPINAGEMYERWVSFEDSAFTNRMHPECAEDCSEQCEHWGDNEYHPYTNQRPPVAFHPV